MPSYIVRLDDGPVAYYLEWSTIVDAPITYGTNREEFEREYCKRHGADGASGLPDRMARVDAKGTSSRIHDNADDVIGFNRAGANETCLSRDQIIEFYCRNQGESERPKGRRLEAE